MGTRGPPRVPNTRLTHVSCFFVTGHAEPCWERQSPLFVPAADLQTALITSCTLTCWIRKQTNAISKKRGESTTITRSCSLSRERFRRPITAVPEHIGRIRCKSAVGVEEGHLARECRRQIPDTLRRQE